MNSQQPDRTPQTCRFREPRAGSTDAICRLLANLSGAEDVEDLEELVVEQAVCQVCCESFEPSERDLNPVIASRLVHLADAVIERNGVPGCSVEQATSVLTIAEESLPVVLFDEDDITAPPAYAPGLKNVSTDEISTCLPLPAKSEPPGSLMDSTIQWAVGVTTCERRNPTLIESLESMVTAGWNDYRLFVDGAMTRAPNEQTESAGAAAPKDLPGNPSITRREPAAGAWSNYYLSLSELYQRQPDADAYMLVQDDSLFARIEVLKDYVDQLLSAIDLAGIVSLYCSAEDTYERAGWFRYADRWRYGALAFVYSNSAVTEFLRHADVISRNRHISEPSQAGIDSLIGDWAFQTNTPLWYSTPSLVQHLGDISTIWKTARAVGLRRASSFLETELLQS